MNRLDLAIQILTAMIPTSGKMESKVCAAFKYADLVLKKNQETPQGETNERDRLGTPRPL